MDFNTALAELEALGTAQNRKIYTRHGVGSDLYGVSYANLKALRKQIKMDHSLALALWESGNHDARILACMVADPAQASPDLLQSWVLDLDNYPLTDAFVELAARCDVRAHMAQAWIDAPGEYVQRAGWHLLAKIAMQDPARQEGALPDAFFEPYLNEIQASIHTRPNRTREAMNNALITLGTRSDLLEARALAAAAAIGPVDVDHGETSCITPDAAAYIRKRRARLQVRAAA